MGRMRFSVQDRTRLGQDALDRIHVLGSDEIPWQCQTVWDGDLLVVERLESGSGRAVVPWYIGERGEHALSTTTLIERERPYLLEVELARGTLNEVRSHIAALDLAGVALPSEVRRTVTRATRRFSQTVTSQDKPARAAALARDVIAESTDAAYTLGAAYTEHALEVRRRATSRLSTMLGVNLGLSTPNATIAGRLAETFSLAAVPFGWRMIEAAEGKRHWDASDDNVDWCLQAGLKVCGGPLLHLDERGVPDWMYLWEDDPDSLLSFMLDHVKAVVSRYRGRVHLWQAAARCNATSPLGLDEEQMLRIVVRTIEAIQELDPRTPIVVSFDQPWSEYMAEADFDLTPLHFADALVRADIGLAGVGLEINAGYWPGGSPHRCPLAYNRLIEQWNQLGLPLLISLTAPSATTPDPLATAESNVLTPPNDAIVTPASQQMWIESIVPMMLAKSAVQVVLWNQLDDGVPHDYPHGGLIEGNGNQKPALDALQTIRQRYLM